MRLFHLNITCLSLCVLSLSIFGQGNKVSWQNNIGGTKMDIGNDIIQDNNNSIYSVGYSYSNDGNFTFNAGWEDATIIKSNSLGFVEWERSIGGSDADVFTSVALDHENIVVAGWSASEDASNFNNRGSEDGLIAKYDSEGALIWTKTIGGNSSDRINKIITLSTGGYILTGYTYSTDIPNVSPKGMTDYWLVKLNESGDIIWQQTYGGSDDDFAVDVIETKNGDLIIVGNSNSIDFDVAGNYGEWDAWVIRTNSTGEIIWQNHFGDISNDEVAAVVEISNEQILLVGNTYSIDNLSLGKSDGWLVKMDANGTLVSESKLGGEENDFLYSAFVSENQEIILAGQTYSNDNDLFDNAGKGDGWLIKLDEEGTLAWQEVLGGEETDDIQKAIVSNSGSILTAGSTKSKLGSNSNNTDNWDFWVLEMNGFIPQVDENDILLFPNPASDFINFMMEFEMEGTLNIFNISGQMVYSQSINGMKKGTIEVSNFPAGTYSLQCVTDNEILNKIFVKN